MGEQPVGGSRVCTMCGTTVPDDRSVCPGCGFLVGPATRPEPAPAMPVPPSPPLPPAPPGGWAGQQPPAWMMPGGASPQPHRPASSPSSGGWGLAVVLIIVVALAAAGVVFLVQSGDDADDVASGSSAAASTTTTAAPTTTTTIPRVTQANLLAAYCDAPGAKWPEVPPHVPGEPDRTQVRFLGGGLANAAPQNVSPRQMGDGSTFGGSTVISPHTDGVFVTNNASVLARTRTVACVRHIGNTPLGEVCTYGQETDFGGRLLNQHVLQFIKNKYEITVYELHSGGILHKGEILTRGGACPEYAFTGIDPTSIAYGLEDRDILDWLGAHFVDGRPA